MASKKLARNLIRQERYDIRKVIGILTGRCPLNKHLFTKGEIDSHLFSLCIEVKETPLHVLTECKNVVDQLADIIPGNILQPEKASKLMGWSRMVLVKRCQNPSIMANQEAKCVIQSIQPAKIKSNHVYAGQMGWYMVCFKFSFYIALVLHSVLLKSLLTTPIG